MSDQPPYPNGPGQNPDPYGPQPPQGPYYGPPAMRPPAPGAPRPGYGPPGPPPPQGPDYLSGPVPARRRKGFLVTAGIVVAALAVSGGAYAVVAANTGDDADAAIKELPSTSLAAAWATLHPGGGTEKTALRVLHQLDSDIPADGSLRDSLLSETLTDTHVNYRKDLKPWLGDHVAAAAVPQGDRIRPLIAAEVTDQAAAKRYLDRRPKQNSHAIAYAFHGNYVLISDSKPALDKAVRAAADSDLEDNEAYTAAAASLDGEQLGVAWADLNALRPYAKKEGEPFPSWMPSGVVAGVRFDNSYVDSQIKVSGGPKISGQKMGKRIGELPDDTTFAIGATNLDKGVRKLAEFMQDSDAAGAAMGPLSALGYRTGIENRDQVAALLGSRTILVAGPGFSTVGLITKSNDPNLTKEQLDKIAERISNGRDFTTRKTSEGTVFASSPGYADRLSAHDGNLGGQDAYRTAVPDAQNADVVVYADLTTFAEVGGNDMRLLKNYRSFGLTCSFSDNGAVEVRIRVVTR